MLTRRLLFGALVVVTVGACTPPQPRDRSSARGIDVSFAPQTRPAPVTGRVYVALSRRAEPSPIEQTSPTGVPMFSRSVERLEPGEWLSVGEDGGHPVARLADIPPGDYWAQAFVNVYTEFKRQDGRTVWLHMDHWEGQNWKRSPGNLYSEPIKIHFDPADGARIALVADKEIAPIVPPPDTDLVKRFRMQSALLSSWWGVPITLGATILLPRDYHKLPDRQFPVVYLHGHFSLSAPGGFDSNPAFENYWFNARTPRFILVTLQHPTPYYDDSYGVDSENNGPYGQAITRELILVSKFPSR